MQVPGLSYHTARAPARCRAPSGEGRAARRAGPRPVKGGGGPMDGRSKGSREQLAHFRRRGSARALSGAGAPHEAHGPLRELALG